MQARVLTRGLARVVAVVALGAALGTAAVGRLDAQTAKAPATPDWSQTVTKEPGTSSEFTPKQLELIQKLTAYFNGMPDMKGEFQQISPDGKRLRGRIYVKRPTYFRFEYRPPSKQLIISDGTNMIVQDLDLKTDDRYGLDKTPFRIVMRKDVDLMRDSKVLEVNETADQIYIILQDKASDTTGKLKLGFAKKPAIDLKEWVSTDSQGLDTKVELTEFVAAVDPPLDPALFVPAPITLQKLQQ